MMILRNLFAYNGQFEQGSPGTYSCLYLHLSRKSLIARESLGIHVQMSIIPAALLVYYYSHQGLTLLGLQLRPIVDSPRNNSTNITFHLPRCKFRKQSRKESLSARCQLSQSPSGRSLHLLGPQRIPSPT